MTEEEILQLIQDNTPEQSQDSIKAVQQYNPATHAINNKNIYPDKTVYKPLLDQNGNQILVNGEKQYQRTIVKRNRIAIPMQQTIVSLRKYFMNLKGSVLSSDNDQSELLKELNKVRKSNKYSFKIEEIAERTMSELSSAEMWWISDKDNEIKMRVLSPEKGDLLLPLYDDSRDLVVFLRSYSDKKGNPLLDVFTNDVNYTFDADNKIVKTWTNKWGKIPIIYYSQELPEWENVQQIIERYELLISNFSDTVDYTGSPIVLLKGNVNGMASKDDSGKTLELEPDASVSYLSNDGAPEAIKTEEANLKWAMYSQSHTPDISIQSLKGAGTSGTAYDRLFLDAQLAAASKLSGTFGESMQRSVNLVSAMVRSVNNSLPDDVIELETLPYKFDDLNEEIKNLVLSKGILSNETITKILAGKLGIDEAEEWERVKKQNGRATIEEIEEEF